MSRQFHLQRTKTPFVTWKCCLNQKNESCSKNSRDDNLKTETMICCYSHKVEMSSCTRVYSLRFWITHDGLVEIWFSSGLKLFFPNPSSASRSSYSWIISSAIVFRLNLHEPAVFLWSFVSVIIGAICGAPYKDVTGDILPRSPKWTLVLQGAATKLAADVTLWPANMFAITKSNPYS